MPEWFSLKMPCPVRGCNNSRNDVILNWVCAKDKTKMFISEEGRLACSNYPFDPHNDKIANWKFDCGDRSSYGPHRGEHFIAADFQGFAHAMSIAVANSSVAGAEWVMQLMINVKEQYEA
ncbi:uncharacterized protein LOC111319513 [Stylophora pistillata]|uniref:Uncharacterized protein n=1 Tax=Stylophora pistillata TaxID=50429 RepID=A0A2B4R5M7_STYPI|nr:uncharacterized protein LOC111319513 [Stylophora pistillata]PFX11585.1 hypothetical protein AWC38_SpisGene24626 [Stylophora pistillata]